ncbi:hypothetical protein M3Y97_00183300 [Aphelenchoides bicaudatus]|nr:hypothetical protein M3Y97_00183300 [Aphelenchoides bicaudatus]
MAHSDSTVTPHDEYERRHLRRKWHRMKYTAKFKSIIVPNRSNATYLTDARQTGPILNKISGTVDNLLLVGLNNDTNMATEYGLQNSSVTVVPDGVNSIPDIVKHILGFSTTAIPTTPPALPTQTTVKSSTGKSLVPVSNKSPSTIPHNSSTTVHQPPTLPHNLSTPIHSTTPPSLPTETTVKSSTGKSLVPITNKSPSTIPHNSSTTAIPTTPHVVSTSTSGQTAKTTEKPVKSSTTPEPLKTTTNREVPKTTSTQEPEFSTEFPEPPEVVIIKEAIEEPVKFSNQESSTVATIPTEPIDQPVKSSTTVLPEQPAVVAIKTEAIEQSVKSPEVPAVVAIKEKAIAQPVGSPESSTVATIPTEPTDQPTTPTTVLPEQPVPFEGIIKINTAENSANQTKFEKASVYLYHLLG